MLKHEKRVLQGEELERFNEAKKSAKGISKHEFDQHIIDLCDPLIDASAKRIAQGLSTYEEEEIAMFLALKKKFNQ